jgi:hypothetical protein
LVSYDKKDWCVKRLTEILFIFLFTGFPLIQSCSNAATSDKKFPEKDSVVIAPGKNYKKNFLHNFVFGKHYRDLWATEISVPVFDPDTVKGGLKPVKVGGNIQTVSLHMVDSTGKRYVLRSVDKDLSSLLPGILRTSFLNFIITDQTSAANPFAPLIVDDLAEAAGLYHTHPVYYYVPENMVLLPQANSLSGKMVLLEEKPNSSWKNTSEFGYPDNIITSEELLEQRFGKQIFNADTKLFLRSRLFDMWINDWDRHSEQWEWLRFNYGDSVVYKPFPRDRDGAFYIFDDGVLPFLTSRWWGNIKFQSFHPNYENVDGLLYNSSYIDNLLLTQFTESDWRNTAKELSAVLTDSVIISAVKKWPAEVFREEGENTIRKLIRRRENLVYAAGLAYLSVCRNVSIPATDMDEKITVERSDEATIVKITSAATGRTLYFSRFPTNVTKKITLRGLGGDDEIEISGESGKSVEIEVYGDEGYDTMTDKSHVSGIGKKTKFFDTRTGNKIELGTEAADMTEESEEVFSFNRTGLRNPDKAK